MFACIYGQEIKMFNVVCRLEISTDDRLLGTAHLITIFLNYVLFNNLHFHDRNDPFVIMSNPLVH